MAGEKNGKPGMRTRGASGVPVAPPLGKVHRGITLLQDMILRAVTMKYLHRGRPSFLSDREVAKELSVRPQAVTALIKKGHEEGYFVVYVTYPQETADVVRLEDEVQKRYSSYGLRRVMLVPGLPQILAGLGREERQALGTVVVHAMAQLVAQYLDRKVTESALRQDMALRSGREAKPLILGVAWGRTMHLIAQHLLSTRREVPSLDLKVYPIVGTVWPENPEPIEADVIATVFGRAYGRPFFPHVPCLGIVPRIEADIMMQPKPVRDMLGRIGQCELVFTSMGPIPVDPDAASEIKLSPDPVMNATLFNAARTAGAIGEICFGCFDRNGVEVQTDYTAIGLGFGGLKQIARDPAREVVLVVGGDKRRFEPLKGALRAGLASVLVSDTVTARYLNGEL